MTRLFRLPYLVLRYAFKDDNKPDTTVKKEIYPDQKIKCFEEKTTLRWYEDVDKLKKKRSLC